MIRTIVVDDEYYNVQDVSNFANNTGFFEVVKQYQNPLYVLDELDETCPQVAFIDIEMPEIDGITLAEMLLQKNPNILIVFITSWNQYAVQAFELNAIDYIMKPIRQERFDKMAEKIKQNLRLQKSTINSSELKIQCFGCFEVTIAGTPVKWERAKAEELFAYLLINHDRYVHKEKIIETLWPNYELKKALPVLQTAVCKIRNLFAEIKSEIRIDYSGNRYCLFLNDIKCDILEAENMLLSYNLESPEIYINLEKISELYNKGLFTQQGYLWSIEREQELKTNIASDIRIAATLNMQKSNAVNVVKMLYLLTKLMPEDDEANYQLLYYLKAQGNNTGMRAHYNWLKKTLSEEYDSTPSERINSLIL